MHLATLISRATLLATLASALPAPAPTPTQPPLTQEVTEVLTDTLNIGGNLVNGLSGTWLAARDDTADILPDFLNDITEPLDPVFLVEVQLPPLDDSAKHLPVLTARKLPTYPIVELPGLLGLPLPVLTARKPVEDIPSVLVNSFDEITEPIAQELKGGVDDVLEEAGMVVTSPFQGLFPKEGFGSDDGKARL
ncbi:hypothetical protein LTR56_000547 [Elasticomyces elasticus]|nr:hypothetical protein LTR56_000547 [Elasticomyces elasticus]KAK3664323.1 hypothetical protein LTR22_004736 [Elasticomyces elasticus]KAK4915433.1 hypothetical protein LTR49_016421 [Elasticomyces elasticus]KAK5752816.1 hypothetical protein LTS12_017095 [Elasticomyces elasticus]